jgi:biopolymer transport protein ExbD
MASGIFSTSTYEDEPAPLSAINVTPLVDVTLVLLIVFMITVPAIVGMAPVKVELPESTEIPAEIDQTPIVFTLRYGAAQNVELYLNDHLVDESAVRRYFSELGPAAAGREVSLSAAKEMLWEHVVGVLDLLKKLGVEDVKINTRHVESR